MPSFLISVNKRAEIRANLISAFGVSINWICESEETETGFFVFHVGGVDGKDRVAWTVPDLSVGDEITIRISEDSVVDSEHFRTPFERIDRSKSGG